MILVAKIWICCNKILRFPQTKVEPEPYHPFSPYETFVQIVLLGYISC